MIKPYYETKLGKLYHGNCLDIIPRLESVDLVITSPPYDDLRKYNGYTFEFEGIAKELFKITKEGGTIVWVVGDATINGSETGTSFKQALYFKEIGFNLHDTMIYDKGGAGGCKGSNYAYWNGFEYMFVLVKGKIATFNPIKDRINKYGDRIAQSRSRKKDGTMANKRIVRVANNGRRFNIWQIKQSSKQNHPAAFPESIARDHIISWSNESDIILDPMAGSGTTLKECERLNRKWIGIEISEEYCEVIKRGFRFGETSKALSKNKEPRIQSFFQK